MKQPFSCFLKCVRDLLPNLSAAGIQTAAEALTSPAAVVGAAGAAGVATGGVALPLALAGGLFALHLRLRWASQQAQRAEDRQVEAALNILRRRSKDAQRSDAAVRSELSALGFEMQDGLDKTLARLNELEGILGLPNPDDKTIIEYLRDHEGLMVSLATFLEENFDQLRGIVASLPASVGELRASVDDLRREIGVMHAKIDVLTDGQRAIGARIDDEAGKAAARHAEHDAKLALIVAFIESQKRPGVDPTADQTPPEVLAAARELMASKDARERAQSAIVLRDWETWRKEVDALNAARATSEVFQNKTLEGDGLYAQGMFDEAIGPYEVAYRLRENEVSARNNLAIALQGALRGDMSLRLRRTIEIHEGTLALPDLSRPNWAMTQNNLGNAWANLPTGDRGENLRKAIAAYESALEVRTREAAPMGWARTTSNLGNAWANLPTGDRGENLRKAIAAYESALGVYTRQAAPMDWAMTQNNLGAAWADLPTGDRGENLRKAIAAYDAALTVRTRQAAPMDWAMTHYNLAIALATIAELPGQDRCGLFRSAIASGKGALTVYTPSAFPHDHARTSRNLAIMRRRYEASGCPAAPGGVAFDDIPPAR